ncbi:hypothetical protein Taro_050498 [Colocasia esculenta]|uniref:Uncharacterized protein n=1 Tax=Colocasia esculenta TaxID=4460 RepID=A0A843XEC8_COLES|nr:hypothetical protein [Colocasia esculenta]
MAEEIGYFTLNTGAKIPSVGLGTWQSESGVVGDAIVRAVKGCGFRFTSYFVLVVDLWDRLQICGISFISWISRVVLVSSLVKGVSFQRRHTQPGFHGPLFLPAPF